MSWRLVVVGKVNTYELLQSKKQYLIEANGKLEKEDRAQSLCPIFIVTQWLWLWKQWHQLAGCLPPFGTAWVKRRGRDRPTSTTRWLAALYTTPGLQQWPTKACATGGTVGQSRHGCVQKCEANDLMWLGFDKAKRTMRKYANAFTKKGVRKKRLSWEKSKPHVKKTKCDKLMEISYMHWKTDSNMKLVGSSSLNHLTNVHFASSTLHLSAVIQHFLTAKGRLYLYCHIACF